MQRFPNMVAVGGRFVLPLCGGTACRLAAALVAGNGRHCDRRLLSDALARDACLAVWAIGHAPASGAASPRTVDALADWMSAAAVAPWADLAEAKPAPTVDPQAADDTQSASCESLATLAGRSVGVAWLASHIARHHGLDEQAGYLLGLLHLAPQWLAAANGNSQTSDALPEWLRGELRCIAAESSEIVSTADCVRAAVRWADAGASPEMLPEGLAFDRQAWEARTTATRDDWAYPAPDNLLSGLAAKLGRLHDLEADFARTLEAEKLESLKELAYGAGHEINNPLANISARAQALLSDENDPQRRRLLASINAQAFRAHEMITDMMLFARPPRAKPEPLDVVELLAKLQDELSEQAAGQRTEIVLHAPHVPLQVVADKTQIAVALRSLCINALEALVTGGRVEIGLVPAASNDPSVQITISDNGPGIPAEVRPHIFDPFYSGREAGRGLGLGLSKCWRIVTMHQGRVEVDSPPGGGAVFTVTLPAGNAR